MKNRQAITLAALLFIFNANAQFGGLINKAKNKAEQKTTEKKPENNSGNNNTNSNANSNTNNNSTTNSGSTSGNNSNSDNNSNNSGNSNSNSKSSAKKSDAELIKEWVSETEQGMGKVIGGKSAINATSSNGSQTLNFGEDIYCKVILNKKVNEYPFDGYDGSPKLGGCYAEFICDGEVMGLVNNYGFQKDDVSKSEYEFIVNKRPGEKEVESDDFVKKMNKLSDGEHQITISIVSKASAEPMRYRLAESSYKLIKTATSPKYKFGKSFNDVKAKKSDPALEASAIKCLQAYSNDKKWNYDYKKVKILTPEWTIVKHEYTGAIEGRRMWFACLFYDKDRGCNFMREIHLMQEYNGKGYQSSFVYEDGANETVIDE